LGEYRGLSTNIVCIRILFCLFIFPLGSFDLLFFFTFFPLKKRGGQSEVGAFARGFLAIPLGLSPNSALSFLLDCLFGAALYCDCTELYKYGYTGPEGSFSLKLWNSGVENL